MACYLYVIILKPTAFFSLQAKFLQFLWNHPCLLFISSGFGQTLELKSCPKKVLSHLQFLSWKYYESSQRQYKFRLLLRDTGSSCNKKIHVCDCSDRPLNQRSIPSLTHGPPGWSVYGSHPSFWPWAHSSYSCFFCLKSIYKVYFTGSMQIRNLSNQCSVFNLDTGQLGPVT